MTFVEFYFNLKDISNSDGEILIAQLLDLGFDSFENTDEYLKAYILREKASEVLLKKIRNDLVIKNLDFRFKKLKKKNWNNTWESNFNPVFFESGVVRASFHSIKKKLKYDIIINPKMSFGTGHHETTSMIMNRMFDINFNNKSVLDIGTGTGVLAILASKLEAKKTVACDIDEWAYKNAIENSILNSVSDIDFFHGDHTELEDRFNFDIVLVNINTNNILKNIDSYIMLMGKKSQILLSGFLETDVLTIKDKILDLGFNLIYKKNKNKWQMLHLRRV